MDPELLGLLGLDEPPPADAPALEVESSDGPGQEPGPPPSETALVLDEWDLAKGARLAKEHGRRVGVAGEPAWADLHAAHFSPSPQPAENCTDPRRARFVRGLLESADFQALRTSTVLNTLTTEMAAVTAAKSYAELLRADAERRERAEKRLKAGKKVDPAEEDMKDEIAAAAACAKAVREASHEVEEMEEAMRSMGHGMSGDKADPKRVAELFRRVRSDPTLRRICELAGKYRRVAQGKQRQKSSHGSDDMVGVVMDNDVGRLLPVELAKLADPDLEDETYRRLAERETMCREYKGRERVAKGPVLFCVDESGSMHGDKVNNAKAMALAMAWVCRRQRRWCSLVAYSGDTGERLLKLPPGAWDEAAVCGWLSEFISGGSYIDVPVREVPRYYRELECPAGKTDVVFVTDAQCRIPEYMLQAFLTWKAGASARLITIVVGGAGAGDLAKISDEVHLVGTLTAHGDAAAACFSV